MGMDFCFLTPMDGFGTCGRIYLQGPGEIFSGFHRFWSRIDGAFGVVQMPNFYAAWSSAREFFGAVT